MGAATTEEVQQMEANAQKPTVKRRHDAGITFFIMGLAQHEHLSAKAIARAVEKKYGPEGRPSARTVQDMVREVRSRPGGGPIPKSGAWQIWDAEPEDAPVVLGVLADLMRSSGGKATEISQEDAKWIIRLSRAGVGDLPPSVLHGLAIQYQLREDTRALDALIAFTPWRSEDAFERYRRAVEPIGSIPRSVSMGGIGNWKQLLRRLGFSEDTIAQARDYNDALALAGGVPWVSLAI